MPSSRNGGAKLHFFFELTKIIALFLFNFFLQVEYCLLLKIGESESGLSL